MKTISRTPDNGATPIINHADLWTGDRFVTVSIEAIDPDLAVTYLTYNTHNRNPKRAHISRLAKDMRDGNWQFTASPIAFSESGRLIDGQNRLMAIVEAEVTLPFLVVRNLTDSAQDDIDTVSKRKFGDVLKLRGEHQPGHLAALARKVAAWEDGARIKIRLSNASHARLTRCLNEHPELRDISTRASTLARYIPLPGSSIGLLMWVFGQIDADDCEFFFARLADGQGLVKGDPIFELSRTLTNRRKEYTSSGPDITRDLAITIKAWNAYRSGETVGLYRWKPGGAKPESFPEPI